MKNKKTMVASMLFTTSVGKAKRTRGYSRSALGLQKKWPLSNSLLPQILHFFPYFPRSLGSTLSLLLLSLKMATLMPFFAHTLGTHSLLKKTKPTLWFSSFSLLGYSLPSLLLSIFKNVQPPSLLQHGSL